MDARTIAPPAAGHLSLVIPAQQKISQNASRPHLLIASNDEDLRHIVEGAARLLRCTAAVVRSGSAATTSARAHQLSLVLLDYALPDVPGLEVARTLSRETPQLRFVLVGRELSTCVTVEAMKLGAVTVLEKPVSVNEIVEILRCAVEEARTAPPAASPANTMTRGPRSICERWAFYVLKGCEADGDLRTIGAWASFAGLSYSSLCEVCRLVGVRPLDARDFTRVLRAVAQSLIHECRVEELLDISDRRTLRALMGRAGIAADGHAERMSVGQYLASQRFLPSNHAGLAVLRGILPT